MGSLSEDRELQAKIGRAMGKIITETESLPYRERKAEIEKRAKAYVSEL